MSHSHNNGHGRCRVCGDAGEARRDREDDAARADVREDPDPRETLHEEAVIARVPDACRGCGDSIPRGQITCGALECGGRAFDACEIHPCSSRVCGRGTRCCENPLHVHEEP